MPLPHPPHLQPRAPQRAPHISPRHTAREGKLSSVIRPPPAPLPFTQHSTAQHFLQHPAHPQTHTAPTHTPTNSSTRPGRCQAGGRESRSQQHKFADTLTQVVAVSIFTLAAPHLLLPLATPRPFLSSLVAAASFLPSGHTWSHAQKPHTIKSWKVVRLRKSLLTLLAKSGKMAGPHACQRRAAPRTILRALQRRPRPATACTTACLFSMAAGTLACRLSCPARQANTQN